ncbi:MAG: hypothetical protein J1F63_01760 [Oscillospiraceae bacterium]|nr:hypothetical protein [Oscillospiraceae bacterium]
MKKLLALILVIASLSSAARAEDIYRAELPNDVIKIYWYYDYLAPKYLELPMLSYEGALYIPISNQFCYYLGLSHQWIDGAMHIVFNGRGPTSVNFNDPATYFHEVRHECKKADYPVYMNGKELTNPVDGFPILNRGGVTYLPLTETVLSELRLYTWLDPNDNAIRIEQQYHGGFGLQGTYSLDKIYKTEDGEVYYIVQYTTGRGNGHHEGYYKYNSFDGETVTNHASYTFFNIYSDRPSVDQFFEAENVHMENGSLMYGDEVIEEGVSAAEVSAKEYRLGSKSLLTVSTGGYGARTYIRTESGFTKTDLLSVSSSDIFRYADTAEGCTYFSNNSNYVYVAAPDGSVTKLNDGYHKRFWLIGEIGGRPLVRATWEEPSSYGNKISLSNDGFFTVEPDGSLKRYADFAYSTDAFTLGDRLYLVDLYYNCFIDALTGERFSFDIKQ